MKKKPVIDQTFAEGDPIIVVDKNSEFMDKTGVVERLGSAGEDVTYVHARLQGVNTVMAFRTFQVQKGS